MLSYTKVLLDKVSIKINVDSSIIIKLIIFFLIIKYIILIRRNMMKNTKSNLIYVILTILIALIINIRLPYYISAPGGTINLNKRI